VRSTDHSAPHYAVSYSPLLTLSLLDTRKNSKNRNKLMKLPLQKQLHCWLYPRQTFHFILCKDSCTAAKGMQEDVFNTDHPFICGDFLHIQTLISGIPFDVHASTVTNVHKKHIECRNADPSLLNATVSQYDFKEPSVNLVKCNSRNNISSASIVLLLLLIKEHVFL